MPNRNQVVGTDAANTINGSEQADLIYGYNPSNQQVSLISAVRIATGLNAPIFADAPDGDVSRLFVVEKGGLIKILDVTTNQVAATPFIDISGSILTAGEQGLLGLTFDPAFATNGYFYVNVIGTTGNTEIRRYQVSEDDPNVADPNSATLLLSFPQDGSENHKAGWIDFGPDGFLYVATGDGGLAGDPKNNAQNEDLLLGKMLRINVAADDFPTDPNRNYSIPTDNMFVGVAGADEIFALGLRNPWRDSFDRGRGDLYIADVGQEKFEEINIGLLGANYGWNVFEGHAEHTDDIPGPGNLTAPIYVYDHSVGRSITGGYVYRGGSDALQGQYFYADFVTGKIYTLAFDGSAWVGTERSSQITTDIGSIDNVASFGEDALGNLYVIDYDGDVFRLTPNAQSPDRNDTLRGLGGDDMMFGGAGDDKLYGGDGRDELRGGTGNDVLEGGAGADLMDGGVGADRMTGGEGDDLYIVDNQNDSTTERANQGLDRVFSSASFRLGENVEILQLTGTANIDGIGGKTANVIIGNAGANNLRGGEGENRLDGAGGNDSLEGGRANDTFVFKGNFGNDVVTGFRGNGANQGDIIEFEPTRFADFAEVMLATADTGSDLVITSGSDSVTLKGVKDKSLLHESDFTFV